MALVFCLFFLVFLKSQHASSPAICLKQIKLNKRISYTRFWNWPKSLPTSVTNPLYFIALQNNYFVDLRSFFKKIFFNFLPKSIKQTEFIENIYLFGFIFF